MEQNKDRRFARIFLVVYLIVVVLVAGYNFVIDPYFCYRVTDKIKYFSYDITDSPTWKYGLTKQYTGYDAVWVGSSLSTHVDVEYVNEKMGVNCVGVVQASGRPNIYGEFIRNIQKKNDLKYVFYELNLTHWCWPSIGTEFDIDQYVADYVKTDSVLDDADYLLNRRTTKESSFIVAGMLDEKVEQIKNQMGFVSSQKESENQDDIMPADTVYSTGSMAKNIISNNYTWGFRGEEREEDLKIGMNNIDRYVAPLIEENPQTQFVFVVPPTGVMVFACLNQAGCLDDYLYIMEEMYGKLLSYPNVKIIAANLDADYNMDTNHYMDDGHYEPSGATMMIDFIAKGKNEITSKNLKKRLDEYRTMANTFQWPFLKLNFVGDEVSDLQNKLVLLGYEVEVKGVYDDKTEEAVKSLQKDHGMEPSGIALPETLELMDRLVENKRIKS